MKIPDGLVFLYHPTKTGITVEQIDLVKCKNCKFCVQNVFFGTPFLSCEQYQDAKKFVNEEDWCCWGEKHE